MNVIFAGTPEFARIALDAIVTAGHTVPLVLTQPDRPAGRGLQLQPSPVKQSAVSRGIPVAQPRSLRAQGRYPDDARDALAQLRATPHDVIVVAAYGLLLPQAVLDLPRHGCLNIHGSLLPRWRGAAPIQRALEAGDAQTGVAIMQMEAGLDTGPVALERPLPIATDDTAATLHDKLAALGAALIVEALAQLERDGGLPARAQPATGVTYAEKIDKAEARLDFSLPAAVLERKIRAFNPFPGATAGFGGTPVKLWAATLGGATTAAPGTVVTADANGVAIACGDGRTLIATALQKPGGKRLGARAFLQGFALAAGDVCAPPSA